MDYTATLALINGMSVEDRIRLVQDIWDGLVDQEIDVELTDAQKHEIDQRLVEHEANPDSAVPWDIMRTSLDARMRTAKAG